MPQSADKSFKETLLTAMNLWNQAGQKISSKNIFNPECKEPGLKVVLDTESGKLGDGMIKLGVVLQEKKSQIPVLFVREKELQEYQWMLAVMIRQEKYKNPKADLKKLAEFSQNVETRMLTNLLMHELGHVLGLAHNFNPAEKSIMGYSQSTELSDYDVDALKKVLGVKASSNKKWKPELVPPKGIRYSGS